MAGAAAVDLAEGAEHRARQVGLVVESHLRTEGATPSGERGRPDRMAAVRQIGAPNRLAVLLDRNREGASDVANLEIAKVAPRIDPDLAKSDLARAGAVKKREDQVRAPMFDRARALAGQALADPIAASDFVQARERVDREWADRIVASVFGQVKEQVDRE